MSSLAPFEYDFAGIESYYVESRVLPWGAGAEWLDTRLGDEEEAAAVIPIAPSLAAKSIDAAVEASRTILDLEDDWDGEGSIGYRLSTWERATAFLLRQADYAKSVMRLTMDTPRISPAQDGSIDLYWELNSQSLLINIPSDSSVIASYYGQTEQGDTVGGNLTAETIRPDLIAWATRLH